MTLEEIVARFEKERGIISLHEIDALIASWRERGEALEARDELIARLCALYNFSLEPKDKP